MSFLLYVRERECERVDEDLRIGGVIGEVRVETLELVEG